MNSILPANLEGYFPPTLFGTRAGSFQEQRLALLEGAGAFLRHYQELIRADHRQGASGKQVVADLTLLADTLIEVLFRAASSDLPDKGHNWCALIALGGYGRSQLNPRSDIDIMFYYSGKGKEFSEQLSERMLYLLWDLGLDVGYSVRNVRHCLDIAEQDITARTALLDSRFLVGNPISYQEYEKMVLDKVLAWQSKAYIRQKMEENARRLGRYGSSVYLLEPNIKEGEGGLRDLHTAIWIAQVKFKGRSMADLVAKSIMTEREQIEFDRAFDYLWRIRNELHYLSNGKNEQLRFDQQEKIARFLGYCDDGKALAVEQFMQDYYAHATHVEEISSRLIAKVLQHDESPVDTVAACMVRQIGEGFYVLGRELRLREEDLFVRDPAMMMRAFRLAQVHEVNLSLQIKILIRDNLHRLNDRIRRSRVMVDNFMDILRDQKGPLKSLRDMHHLRFLNHFIPEFGRIYCKVQHDAYHIYTVDIHSLFAIAELSKLWEGIYAEDLPQLTQVANDIEKRELLLLAILLHDVGKGEGRDHCNKGADLMPTVARRLGLNREDSRRLEFLVRHHLQMAHISQRRDLHDDRLIVEFARLMGMSENLKMLYLLTFADLRAVGPDVWSGWKGMLLQELYEKTHLVLERGNFLQEMKSEKVRNRKRKVAGLLADEFDAKLISDRLRHMSTRYLLAYRSDVIADHTRLILRNRNRLLTFRVETEPDGAYNQVTVVTRDVPGLFASITGAMAAFGLNILGAQIFTQRDGTALDILQVQGAGGQPLADAQRWQQVEETLLGILEGRIQVEELIGRRKKPVFWGQPHHPMVSSRIDVDNQVSAEYTVVDIYTHDKIGLLYRITRTFRDLSLYIGVAKISTKVDQVADTFYIQDIFGHKLTDPQRLEELCERLLKCLDQE